MSSPNLLFMDRRFAEIAVVRGLLSFKAVCGGLCEQIENLRRGRYTRTLPSILIERGLMTLDQAEAVLNEMSKRPDVDAPDDRPHCAASGITISVVREQNGEGSADDRCAECQHTGR